MNRIALIVTLIASGIPWMFPSVEWYWKMIIMLFILMMLCVVYCIMYLFEIKKITSDAREKAEQLNELKAQNEKLQNAFEQEENDRKKVGGLYGRCERDSEKFIADIREARQDLYQVHRLLNQSKTRRNADLIKEVGRISESIRNIVEGENKHGRERSISNHQDY